MDEQTLKTAGAVAGGIGTAGVSAWKIWTALIRYRDRMLRAMVLKAAKAGHEEAAKLVEAQREDVMNAARDNTAALEARIEGIDTRLARTETQIDRGFEEIRRKMDDVQKSVLDALRGK